METPEQVIAKIRSAPDDAAAMKVLKECGYKLEAEESASEAPRGEGAGNAWDRLMAKNMKNKVEAPVDGA